MFNKPTVLVLVVTALLTAAAWSSGAIDSDAVCTDQADSPKDRLEVHGDVAHGRALDTGGDGSDGSTQGLRFAYDMFDESRLH